jgi:orotate phosphoribosyltransferase
MDAALETAKLLPARDGHFRFESGHHSPRWIDLELLFLHPGRIRPLADELAERLRPAAPEIVCGPLVEGAYVALLVAERLDLPLVYTERFDDGDRSNLFSVRYRLPGLLREVVRGRRVAIVNDVVSAGSAVKGTHADLVRCEAEPVALAALAVLGESAAGFAKSTGLELHCLLEQPLTTWRPEDCPLCADGVPLSTRDAS